MEKNADERIKSVRQDLETELAKLRDSLTKRELEQAELKKDLDEERLLRKQLETLQKPNIQVESPSLPNGIYIIKSRTGNIYWGVEGWPHLETVHFQPTKYDISRYNSFQVNEHSLIIQVLEG